MKDPFKKGEILDDGGEGGCVKQAFSVAVLMVALLSGLGYLAYAGISGFVDRL